MRSQIGLMIAGFLLLVTLSMSAGALLVQSSDSVPSAKEADLCTLQKDFARFSHAKKASSFDAQALPCDDLLATKDALRVSDAPEDAHTSSFEDELRHIVAGTPMEPMVPAIAVFDREIAGLIVGIGKKESNWGVHTPKAKGGAECFNFWGYRGAGDLGLTPDGYGCFSTPAAAVAAIGNRLEELEKLRASTSPSRMVIWKCGNSCASHDPESVRKWIADVNLYYQKIARGASSPGS